MFKKVFNSSAISILHKPTGIMIGCWANRKMHINRQNCLDILKAKMYIQEEWQHPKKEQKVFEYEIPENVEEKDHYRYFDKQFEEKK